MENDAFHVYPQKGRDSSGKITPERFVATQATDGGSASSLQTGAGQAIPHAASVMSDPQPNGNSEAALNGSWYAPEDASPFATKQALDDYFFRQTRLPPIGATAFDQRLTPAWAGLKLPF